MVTVDSTTVTSISLSWTSAGSVVDNYEAVWSSEECLEDEDEGSSTITDGSLSYTIMGLREGSSYTITVTATNAAWSAVSDPVTGMTEEIGKCFSVNCFVRSLSNLSSPAPSSPPTSVSTSDVTSSSITVQWGAVDCIHRNGDITGYSVRYGVQGSGSTQTESVSGGATTERTVSGLESSSNYSIEVAAVNSAGTGVYSDPIIRITDGMCTHIFFPKPDYIMLPQVDCPSQMSQWRSPPSLSHGQ